MNINIADNDTTLIIQIFDKDPKWNFERKPKHAFVCMCVYMVVAYTIIHTYTHFGILTQSDCSPSSALCTTNCVSCSINVYMMFIYIQLDMGWALCMFL